MSRLGRHQRADSGRSGVNGSKRKVLIRAERNGYVYVMDRLNGEVLSGDSLRPHHDQQGSRFENRSAAIYRGEGSWNGTNRARHLPLLGRRKGLAAYGFLAARQDLSIHPAQQHVRRRRRHGGQLHRGHAYVGTHVRMYAGPGGHRGEYTAWDPVAAKPVFKIKKRFPVWSGTVATAGDVTFYGTMDGGSKPSTRAPARCFGNIKSVQESSASRLHTRDRMANNM